MMFDYMAIAYRLSTITELGDPPDRPYNISRISIGDALARQPQDQQVERQFRVDATGLHLHVVIV
jgi:hypothetical protein